MHVFKARNPLVAFSNCCLCGGIFTTISLQIVLQKVQIYVKKTSRTEDVPDNYFIYHKFIVESLPNF